MAKKLVGDKIWGETVYSLNSKSKEPIKPNIQKGSWCGHNISLTNDRYGKIFKTQIKDLKLQIKKRLEGLEPSPVIIRGIKARNFFDINSKYLNWYTENQEKLKKRFNSITKYNRIETKVIKNYKKDKFSVKIYASHSILLALFHSITEKKIINENLDRCSDYILGEPLFWENNFKGIKIDDEYFKGHAAEKRYIEIIFLKRKDNKEILNQIVLPTKNEGTLYYPVSDSIHSGKNSFKDGFKVHPNIDLLVRHLGIDIDALSKKLIHKHLKNIKIEEKEKKEKEKSLLKIQKNEKLLEELVNNAPVVFLENKIKPILFKRLGLTVQTDTKQLKTMPYSEYLKTDHWKSISLETKKRANYKCQLCGKKGLLHVHHNDYTRRGEEIPSDLIALCKTCHAGFHKKT